MPKTPNLNLELTTDNSITFEEWRKAINGENDGVTVDKSNAQLIDEFLGNFGSITRYSQTPEPTVELPGELNKLYVFIWDDSTIQLAVWTSNYTEGDKFDLEAFSSQPYPSEDVAYLVINSGGSVDELELSIAESLDSKEFNLSAPYMTNSFMQEISDGEYIKLCSALYPFTVDPTITSNEILNLEVNGTKLIENGKLVEGFNVYASSNTMTTEILIDFPESENITRFWVGKEAMT